MTVKEFCGELDALLQLPSGSLTAETALKSVEAWDSLAAVEFIALADEKLGVSVPAEQLANAITVQDLVAMMNGKVAG